jgi:hypothetical protein
MRYHGSLGQPYGTSFHLPGANPERGGAKMAIFLDSGVSNWFELSADMGKWKVPHAPDPIPFAKTI